MPKVVQVGFLINYLPLSNDNFANEEEHFGFMLQTNLNYSFWHEKFFVYLKYVSQ